MQMIEKVSPAHPDKQADRIAGAIVDYCYTKNDNPKVAVEVLIGHGKCHIIAETSEEIEFEKADEIVKRIAGDIETDLVVVKQDKHLAKNQSAQVKCGDNGIFKGEPLRHTDIIASQMARMIYAKYPYDGKYILQPNKFICCQSNAKKSDLKKLLETTDKSFEVVINPLGDWTGGINVDTGATNRKLGSDMARSVTGGGLHGKDLSKADVSVNIYAFLKAQELNETVELSCAIGDTEIDGKPYAEIVEIARKYIEARGGFEKFAEWGLY